MWLRVVWQFTHVSRERTAQRYNIDSERDKYSESIGLRFDHEE
jgi:hypothetical protein